MPITPLPTDRQDGETIRAAHVNAIAEAANELQAQIDDLPPGGLDAYELAVDNGFVGTLEQWLASLKGDPSTVPGPPGPPAADVGTLAARPAPVDGKVYTATDDESGRLWAADGSSWVPAAPSVASANAGQIVARAALSASVVVNTVANTPVRIPALTTPSFPCPKNATVEHSWVRFHGHGVGTSEVAQLQLRWSADNWATSSLLWGETVDKPGAAPFYIANSTDGSPAMLPREGVTLAVGAAIQVAMFVLRTDVKALTFMRDSALAFNPFIQVRAG